MNGRVWPWRSFGMAEPGLISPVTSTMATKSPSTSVMVIGALCNEFFRFLRLVTSGERVCSLPGISILIFKLSSSLVELAVLVGIDQRPEHMHALAHGGFHHLLEPAAVTEGAGFSGSSYSLGLV